MEDKTIKMIVCTVTAVATIMWLPLVIADWSLLTAVSSEIGAVFGTILFLVGGYDLLETVGIVQYP